ncbi:MAG: hypothetical protein KF718_03510 [Polyangiaceae bacterium]|nr:hypothetical protein [Polyangiaceae bacterium]
MRPLSALLALAGALTAPACLLSFDDSEVDATDAAAGGSGALDASLGGTGGSSGSGGTAGAGGAGGTAGSSSGGTSGAGGGTGGATGGTGGTGGATGGTGGATGGTGGATGGTGGATGGTGGATGGTGGSTGPNVPDCPVGSDNFNTTAIGPMWWPWGNSVSATGGELVLQPVGTVADYAGVTTSTTADLRSCGVSVEVKQVLTSTNGTSVYFLFDSSPSDVANTRYIEWNQGALHAGLRTAYYTSPYDPVAMRWWRIAASGGSTRMYTSPDGSTWTERGSAPTPAAHSTGRVEIGAGTWTTQGANIGAVKLDNFNP